MAQAVPTSPSSPSLGEHLEPSRHRDYRLLLQGGLVSNIGDLEAGSCSGQAHVPAHRSTGMLPVLAVSRREVAALE